MRPFVWSSQIHKMSLQIWVSSFFYLVHLLYHYHQSFIDIERENIYQLFIDIKRENILCVLDRVSFIEVLAMTNLYY